MLKEMFYLIILAIGFPAGLILAKMCKDEIKSWRKRLLIICGISLILGIIIFFTYFEYKIPVIITLSFIIITDLTIYWKSC